MAAFARPNKANHPVFGDGKTHPVHQDKMIGKYKNADKMQEKMSRMQEKRQERMSRMQERRQEKLAEMRGLDKESRKREVETMRQRREKIAKSRELSKEKLAQIETRRMELLKRREELMNSESENPLLGAFNRWQAMMNDNEIERVENQQVDLATQMQEDEEQVAEINFLESSINLD